MNCPICKTQIIKSSDYTSIDLKSLSEVEEENSYEFADATINVNDLKRAWKTELTYFCHMAIYFAGGFVLCKILHS